MRDSSGKQYKVIQVNEAEANEFADPPRKWGRVGAMAAEWAIVLALGAWVAPGFAASGSEENEDARDQAATDANGAALRYLRYGSSEDLDRAEAALCEDADPVLSPSDLDAIRQSYDEELGGITRVDLEAGDPVASSDGIQIAGTVSYIYEGNQRHKEFMVTVQENDGTYCVSNAVAVEDEEPSQGDGTGEAVDPESVAIEFLRTIVIDRDAQTATALQCDSYTGTTAQDLDAAITEWASTNGEASVFLNSIEPAESTETSITSFESEVSLQGELRHDTFTFVIGVQGDCVGSLTGGDGLI